MEWLEQPDAFLLAARDDELPVGYLSVRTSSGGRCSTPASESA
jgi:hypothetical protein